MEESLALFKQIKQGAKVIVISSQDCANVLKNRCPTPISGTLLPLTLRSRGHLYTLFNFTRNLFSARNIINKQQPDIVVCLGSSLALPIFVAAKFRRCPTIFIESITRSEMPSYTAKILQKLRLIDHLLVQWPDLCDKIPQARYKGTIL